jgi:CBS domain-containing protein
MTQHAYRAVPQCNGISRGAGRNVWFLAFGSLAVAVIAGVRYAAGRGRGRKIRDVMVADVLTVEPSATLMEAAQTMRNANVGVLPVVGHDRTLLGLITDRDLVVRAMSEGADPATSRVREFATQDLICARADSPVTEALEVMRECQIGRLPVVDYDNKVIGMVTLSSLALRARDHDAALHAAEDVARRSARVA